MDALPQIRKSCDEVIIPTYNIPVRITHRHMARTPRSCNTTNNISITLEQTGPPLPKVIPKCMVINARSLAKPDAAVSLNVELSTNNIDICFVTETWLNDNIPSSLVCLGNYVFVRKDRCDSRSGGGVAILCRDDWKVKNLDFDNNLECVWCEIVTVNTKYYVASVYHPPDPIYPETELLNHLSETIEQILYSEPNARIIIAGDINQLKTKDLISQHNLEQLVKKPTRNHKILDVFLTNCPHLWEKPKVFKGLVRTDHLVVMVSPRHAIKPERKHVYFRDVRAHRKFSMMRKLETCDWNHIYNSNDVNDTVTLLNDTITDMFNECFPLIKIKVSTRDPPYMSPLVKHLCMIRNKNIAKGVKNDLQKRIDELIRENLVRSVNDENRKNTFGSKKWWDTVNRITGRKSKNSNISSVIDPQVINSYFQNVNTDANYISPQLISIPVGTRVPTIDEPTVISFLTKLKRTAPGPDGLPYWLWKDFAQPLAPIITKVFNLSIKQQCVPLMWKLANVNPLPKESPVTECNQLRPISLTNIIMRLFERVVYKQEIASAFKSVIGRDQFAYKEGTNTTDALIMCLHQWLKWLDEGADCVRVISFDYKKAFDSVSHNIICEKLKTLEINPYAINWIISFLANRKQRVVVDGKETVYVDINKGVPQGTVLGPFLFSLMVNDIKPMDAQNNLLVKFADDITTSAPVKSGMDSAEAEAEGIQNWSEANRMTLNLSKTWEMVVQGESMKPLPAPITGIERKSWLKLLGVTFQENPCCWDLQIDDLLSKASGRMYILRVCRCYGYSADHLSKLFDSLIMSLFYYCIEVWGSALQNKYLDRIDKFFRRAYRYGYTKKSIKISEVIEERDRKLFSKIVSNPEHALHELLPACRQRTLRERKHNFILPQIRTERFKRSFINRCLFNYF